MEENCKGVVVLLSACINPGEVFSVARREPSVRLADYMESLRFILASPGEESIVFCENSGADLTEIVKLANLGNIYNRPIEILSFYGQPPLPQYGKGYGEMRIIEYALKNSSLIGGAKLVLKVTGRLKILNLSSISRALHGSEGIDIYCDLRHNLMTTDSRVFCATPNFLAEYFVPLLSAMDESKGICFEDLLARAAHSAMASGKRWAMLPLAHNMSGVSGTANVKLATSPLNFLFRKLFRLIKMKVLAR